MAENIDMTKLDKRTAERYVRAGLLDEKAYERYIKSLPDLTEKSTVIETVMPVEGEGDEETKE